MSYCRSCGFTMGDARFCGRCGADAWAPAPMAAAAPAAPTAYGAAPMAVPYTTQASVSPPSPVAGGYGYAFPAIDSLKGLGTAAGWLYGVSAAVCGLVGLLLLNQYSTLLEFDDKGTRQTADAYNEAMSATSGMMLLYLLALIATGVVTIVWLWRAVSNLDKFPNPPRRRGPGWAIGGWFIPIAAWIIPKQMIDDAWRGGSAEGTGGRSWTQVPVPPIINLWWAGWVSGSIVSAIGGQMMGSDDIGTVESGLLVSGAGEAFLIAGAVFAIIAIQQISRRHHDAATALGLVAR